MAPAEWSWLGSEGVCFIVLNAVVVAIAVLSRARPSLASLRHGGVTRRASSAALHRLRSFNIFSYPSGYLSFLQPDEEGARNNNVSQETEEPVVTDPINESASRELALSSPSASLESAPAAEEEDDDDDEGDPNAMSMEEAYALVLAARRRPESETEEAARRSEVDAKAEEFILAFKEELRQQRLNSIFNYTQMLKQRAQGASRR